MGLYIANLVYLYIILNVIIATKRVITPILIKLAYNIMLIFFFLSTTGHHSGP